MFVRLYSLDSEVISCQTGIINLEHQTGIICGGIKDLQPKQKPFESVTPKSQETTTEQ